MPGLRDHQPIVLDEFNGLWKRGDPDSCPLDHFTDCLNVQYIESGFETRPGLDTFRAIGNIVRMYNYKTQTEEGLLLLNTDGEIYHALLDGSETVYGPVLTIADMEDFDFHSPNGYAYITPFATYTDDSGRRYQKGLENEFVYVYKGDGTSARKAAGFPPSISASPTSFKAFNSRFDGVVTKGVHLVAVKYVGGAGAVAVQVFPVVYAPGGKQIQTINIPIGPGGTTGRQIVMTRAIDPKNYVPNQGSYTYYDAVLVNDNTTTSQLISIADSALVTPNVLGALPSLTALHAAPASSTGGYADLGFHLIAVVYETDTGYLTALGPENFAAINVVDLLRGITVTNIPVSGDSAVVKRHLVATRAIYNYNGDQTGYNFYFIPEGNIDDNTTTTKTVSFYDADLLDDASHLIDNFSEIPAGTCLTGYHGRMVLTTTFDDISLAYLSAPGEPEAIDQVDGQIIVPLDGMPITCAQEFRDVLYLFKQTRTYGSSDNGDVPSTWAAPTPLDQAYGCPVHGVGFVLDSGGVNVDFLLIADYSGMLIFNGAYAIPELSWKIADFWKALDRDYFNLLQIANDSVNKILYILLPDGTILMGNYESGLDTKNISWCPWSFDVTMNTICLVQTDKLLLAAAGEE